MARARGGRDDEGGGGGGAPGWMVTYGDLMTLLLTFFVLLLSFSTIHEEEFKKAMASLQGALGVLNKEEVLLQLIKPIYEPPVQRRMQDAAIRLAKYIKVHGLEGKVRVTQIERGGIKVTLQSPVLFDTGKADLKPGAAPILTDVTGMLKEIPDRVIGVEGHTDNVPIHTEEFPSNLELSVARAVSVARYLIDEEDIDAATTFVSGFGENRPVATNDTPDGRARNRRVELTVRPRGLTGQPEPVT